MFNIEISGNLKFHLQTIRKRMKTDKCVELRIPDHLILEDALAVTRFIFYKNTFYKNNQAQIWKK